MKKEESDVIEAPLCCAEENVGDIKTMYERLIGELINRGENDIGGIILRLARYIERAEANLRLVRHNLEAQIKDKQS